MVHQLAQMFHDDLYNFYKDMEPFVQEISLKFLEQQYKTETKQDILKCIKFINYYKFKIIIGQVQIKDLASFTETAMELVQSFVKEMKAVQQVVKKVEKGERLFTDSIVEIVSDLGWELLQQQKDVSDPLVQNLLIFLTILGEISLVGSPYNVDIQCRLMKYYRKLGNFTRITEIVRSMDQKFVHFETAGYLFITPALELNVGDQIVDLVNSGVQSFQENLKQTREGLVNCLKKENYEQV